jgi:hypothetical protein
MENLQETRFILGTKLMRIFWNTTPDEIADLVAPHLALEREQKVTQAEALTIFMIDANRPQGSTLIRNNSPVSQVDLEPIPEYSIERVTKRFRFLRPDGKYNPYAYGANRQHED